MVCKKSVFAVLVIMLLFMAFPMRSFAYSGQVRYWEYEDYDLPYYRVSMLSFKNTQGNILVNTTFGIDDSVYVLSYETKFGFVFELFSLSQFSINRELIYADGSVLHQTNWASSYARNGLFTYHYVLPNRNIYEYDYPNCDDFQYIVDTEDEYVLRDSFIDYFKSSNFIPLYDVMTVPDYKQSLSVDFGLKNVSGYVENDVLRINWNVPEDYDVYKDAHATPILLDLFVADIDSGKSVVIQYPSSALGNTNNRLSYYDIYDERIILPLSDVEELPYHFKINFVKLTPYQVLYSSEYDIMKSFCGSSSLIYLNVSGTNEPDGNFFIDFNPSYNGVIETPPEVPIIPEDTEMSILASVNHFFSNFFVNMGNLLKNLVVPTGQQLSELFAKMEEFFSARLGFLWFPFDLAIDIANVFMSGEATSTFRVPPININILGGIELYPGGEFEVDSVGIFPYVRIATSIMLSCSVAGLAYRKWDEWIGGHE